MKSFCKCKESEKHGQTSVMCCNHCGLPDEEFWQEPPASSQPVEGVEDLMPETKDALARLAEKHNKADEEFVQKHLEIIMEKTLDAMIVVEIEKMYGGIQMASVQHFLDTGKVSGSLYLAIKELAKKFAANWHNQAAKLSPASNPLVEQDEKDKEIERLKGLIESLHTDAFGISPELWLQYKTENNL